MKCAVPDIKRLMDRITARDPACEILQDRRGKLVSRITAERGRTIVLKLWPKDGLRQLPKRWFKATAPYAARRAGAYLSQHGIRVPEIYAFTPLPRSVSPVYGYAMCMEDLGNKNGTAHHYCSSLLKSNEPNELAEMEEAILGLTSRMLQIKSIDVDHRMINLYVTDDREVAKVDLELVRTSRDPGRHPKEVALMLGHLMGSFTFTVQPDKDRAGRFAARVLRLSRDKRTRTLALNKAMGMLETQRRQTNIEPSLSDSLRRLL
jgi:hypothetical protein